MILREIQSKEKPFTLTLQLRMPQLLLIVFDSSSIFFSNDDLENWINLIKEKAPNVIIALIKHKSDLTENIKFNENSLRELVNKYKIMYFITSAKENQGIKELYEGLIKNISGWNGNQKMKLIK